MKELKDCIYRGDLRCRAEVESGEGIESDGVQSREFQGVNKWNPVKELKDSIA